MAGELEAAFAKFEALPKEKRAQADEALSFLTTAQMPTQQGAKNRAVLASHPLDPGTIKTLAAYRAYKFKLSHAPLPEKDKALMRLGKVPDDEIARLDSREKWEQDQLAHFNPLMDLINNTKPASKVVEMAPEKVTAPRPKAKTAVPPAPAAASMPVAQGAAPGAEGAALPLMSGPPSPPVVPAPISPGPLIGPAAPVMTIGGQPLPLERPPLAVALNGGY